MTRSMLGTGTLGLLAALVAAPALLAQQQGQRQGQQPGAQQQTLVGKNAPAFDLKDFEGKPHNLQDYRGKVVILEWIDVTNPMWAQKLEDPACKAEYERYKAQGVVFLPIFAFSGTQGIQGTQGQGTQGQGQRTQGQGQGTQGQGTQGQGQGTQGQGTQGTQGQGTQGTQGQGTQGQGTQGTQGQGNQGMQGQGMQGQGNQGMQGQVTPTAVKNISEQQAIEACLALKEEHAIDFPILLDPAGRVTRQYMVTRVPHVVIVDKQGLVTYQYGISDLTSALDRAISGQSTLPASTPRDADQERQMRDRLNEEQRRR